MFMGLLDKQFKGSKKSSCCQVEEIEDEKEERGSAKREKQEQDQNGSDEPNELLFLRRKTALNWLPFVLIFLNHPPGQQQDERGCQVSHGKEAHTPELINIAPEKKGIGAKGFFDYSPHQGVVKNK